MITKEEVEQFIKWRNQRWVDARNERKQIRYSLFSAKQKNESGVDIPKEQEALAAKYLSQLSGVTIAGFPDEWDIGDPNFVKLRVEKDSRLACLKHLHLANFGLEQAVDLRNPSWGIKIQAEWNKLKPENARGIPNDDETLLKVYISMGGEKRWQQ